MIVPAAFVYLSVERLSNEFYRIYCRAKLNSKLLDRLFHRRRQASPMTNNITHRLFDGFQHSLHGNLTVGSRHRLSPPLLSRKLRQSSSSTGFASGRSGFRLCPRKPLERPRPKPTSSASSARSPPA